MRHVGYGVPTELFSPYVTSAVEVRNVAGKKMWKLLEMMMNVDRNSCDVRYLEEKHETLPGRLDNFG